MTPINYLIDEDRVTFYKDSKIQVAERSVTPWLYDSFKEALPAGDTELSFNTKDIFINAVKNRKQMFGIAERVEALEAAGMPVDPYVSFISRLPEEVLVNHTELISKVGTVDAPLTWTGDLVLYQRSAWTQGEVTSWADDESTFTPFNVVKSDKHLRAGEFSYAMNVCPDTGCAYEVVVQPEHIISGSSGLWTVSQVMQLAQLGREMTTMQQSESPIVRYENKCIGDSNIAMRLPYNPVTAATVAEFMFRHNKQLELVNAPVVQAVSC